MDRARLQSIADEATAMAYEVIRQTVRAVQQKKEADPKDIVSQVTVTSFAAAALAWLRKTGLTHEEATRMVNGIYEGRADGSQDSTSG